MSSFGQPPPPLLRDVIYGHQGLARLRRDRPARRGRHRTDHDPGGHANRRVLGSVRSREHATLPNKIGEETSQSRALLQTVRECRPGKTGWT